MDRVETIGDACLADAAGDRHLLVRDRRHHRLKGHARQLLELALEAIEIAVSPALRDQGGIVGAGHGAVVRIGVVADGLDHDVDATVGLVVGADMGEGRIAAEHLAVTGMHHASADSIAELKSHLVETFKHQPCPRPTRIPEHSIPLSAAMDKFRGAEVGTHSNGCRQNAKIRRSLRSDGLSANAGQPPSPGREDLRPRPSCRSARTRSSSGSARRSGRGRLASSDGGPPDSPCSRC